MIEEAPSPDQSVSLKRSGSLFDPRPTREGGNVIDDRCAGLRDLAKDAGGACDNEAVERRRERGGETAFISGILMRECTQECQEHRLGRSASNK